MFVRGSKGAESPEEGPRGWGAELNTQAYEGAMPRDQHRRPKSLEVLRPVSPVSPW